MNSDILALMVLSVIFVYWLLGLRLFVEGNG